MIQTITKKLRILAIAPTSRGFGYCVMENEAMLEYGTKGVKGDKNLNSISKIEKLMKQFRPEVLVLQDVNAKYSRRAGRIKKLNRDIVRYAGKQKCKVALFSGSQLRTALLDNAKGTKHAMATAIAQKFPVELAGKLPPKRRVTENEGARMDMFDAVALAVVFRMLKSGTGR